MSAGKDRACINKKRSDINTVHFCAKVLSQPVVINLCIGMIGLAAPLEDRIAVESDNVAHPPPPHGTLELFLELQQGAFGSTILKTLDKFSSVAFAESLGASGEQMSGGGPETMCKIANKLLVLCVRGSGSLMLSNMMHTDMLPMCFVGLLSKEGEVVKNTLARLQKMWEVLGRLESASLAEPPISEFLVSLRFPLEHFSRELLVFLAEVEFKETPQSATRSSAWRWASTRRSSRRTHSISCGASIGRMAQASVAR